MQQFINILHFTLLEHPKNVFLLSSLPGCALAPEKMNFAERIISHCGPPFHSCRPYGGAVRSVLDRKHLMHGQNSNRVASRGTSPDECIGIVISGNGDRDSPLSPVHRASHGTVTLVVSGHALRDSSWDNTVIILFILLSCRCYIVRCF
jgi:hypothetical protein